MAKPRERWHAPAWRLGHRSHHVWAGSASRTSPIGGGGLRCPEEWSVTSVPPGAFSWVGSRPRWEGWTGRRRGSAPRSAAEASRQEALATPQELTSLDGLDITVDHAEVTNPVQGGAMRRNLLIVLLTVAALLLPAATANAITFGQPDGNLHPNVGALVADWDLRQPRPGHHLLGHPDRPHGVPHRRPLHGLWRPRGSAAVCDLRPRLRRRLDLPGRPGGGQQLCGQPPVRPCGASDTHDIAVGAGTGAGWDHPGPAAHGRGCWTSSRPPTNSTTGPSPRSGTAPCGRTRPAAAFAVL